MQWIVLTATDVESVMTAEERELAHRHTTESLPDRLASVLADVVAEIRENIGSHQSNTLSADPNKIPPGFKAKALVLARARVFTGIGDYVQDEDRRKETETAEKWLLKVADGTIRPQKADDAIENTAPAEKPSGVQVVSGPGSRTGRTRMDGI